MLALVILGARFVWAAEPLLGDALDAPAWDWSSAGDAYWTVVSSPTHDGLDAAESGAVADNQASAIGADISGPGTLSFWWKVSSEPADTLTLFLDGQPQAAISGEQDWTQASWPVPTGTHILVWEYAKDPGISRGQDRAWLDQVSFTPAVPLPALQISNSSRGITLLWPQAATNSVLQETARLSAATAWSNVVATPVTNAPYLTLTISNSDRQKFFRLRRP